MLLLDGDVQEEHLDDMFGHLQEKVTWLTERPYLPDHMAFRILTLLRSLIEVGLSALSVKDNAVSPACLDLVYKLLLSKLSLLSFTGLI